MTLPAPTDDTISHALPNLPATAAVPPSAVGRPTGGWRLLVRGPVNQACCGVVALYLLVAVASLLPGPRTVLGVRRLPVVGRWYGMADLIDFKYDAEKTYAPPSLTWTDDDGGRHHGPARWCGLDFEGHSVFWRTLYGARTAMLIAVLTSTLVLVIGTAAGVTAGYFGGWIDDLITWVYSVLNMIPWVLLVVSVTYVLQQNASLADERTVAAQPGAWGRFWADLLPVDIVIVILALGLTDWVGLCRLVRGEVIKLRDSDMVTAARAIGLSEPRILVRHIVPNVTHLVIITFTLGAIGYLQVEVILAFLGLGVTSKPSWGRMIDDAKVALLRGVWWEVASATAAIFIICMALTLLGDALRDALDPKTRGRS